MPNLTPVTALEQRLAALHEYRLLDAPAGDELQAVARVAAMVPVARASAAGATLPAVAQ